MRVDHIGHSRYGAEYVNRATDSLHGTYDQVADQIRTRYSDAEDAVRFSQPRLSP